MLPSAAGSIAWGMRVFGSEGVPTSGGKVAKAREEETEKTKG